MGASKFLILAMCIWISISIHLTHQITSSYLSQLKNQQQTITFKTDELQQNIDDTTSRVRNSNNVDQKITILQNAILQQKSILHELSKNTGIPLQELQWTCPQWEGTNQNQVVGLANEISSLTDDIEGKVNDLEGGVDGKDALVGDANDASDYADQIQDRINANGKIVPYDQFEPIKQSNLLTDNLVTGGKDKLQSDLQNNEQNYDYVGSCSLEQPYFDGHNCISCPNNAPHFNSITKQCFYCQDYNQDLQTCPSLPEYNGFNTDIASERLILPSDVSLTDLEGASNPCPSSKPFYADGSCINCESPTSLFNYTTGQCTSCPENYIYESSQKDCFQGKTYITNLAVGKDRILVPPGKTIVDIQQQQQEAAKNQNIQNCPQRTPFYDGNSCIDCEDGKYFSMISLACMGCPESSSYDVNTNTCKHTQYYSNLINPKWTSTNVKKTKLQIQNAASNANNTQCPENSPFFNGQECVSCSSDQIFSYDTHKCTFCRQGTLFNSNLHSCVNPDIAYQTNPQTAPNLIFGGLSENQWVSDYDKMLEQHPQAADCPSDTPYYDGVSCIRCSDSQPYFNLLYKQCQKCQDGTEYDSKAHECLTEEGNIIAQVPNIQKMAAGIFT